MLLWIALKFCIFVVLKQPCSVAAACAGCELLSNFVSLSSWNNQFFYSFAPSLLWIALKFCIFVVLKQRLASGSSLSKMLWIALKFCIFVVLKQHWQGLEHQYTVVNCSQILYLCRPETTGRHSYARQALLWIALKFCIFVVLKQRPIAYRQCRWCCELLSNFVSLSSWNNECWTETLLRIVVNCSQILYLCRPETTPSWCASSLTAVVNCSQILYLCRPETTMAWQWLILWKVVNCSQILYLCRPETTKTSPGGSVAVLWIALKFCIFVVLKQLRHGGAWPQGCCELLSNFVSLSSWNNMTNRSSILRAVVNCSQILYLCRPETTLWRHQHGEPKLWIALKFCIFVVLKQHNGRCSRTRHSCELLSNFVSLSSWNNCASLASLGTSVVNCSQILYLCRPETTEQDKKILEQMLWIALKFCIFVVLKQQQ